MLNGLAELIDDFTCLLRLGEREPEHHTWMTPNYALWNQIPSYSPEQAEASARAEQALWAIARDHERRMDATLPARKADFDRRLEAALAK